MAPRSYAELVRDARARIREVGAEEARARLDAGDGCVFLDVREADEVARGVIPGAVWLPLGLVPTRVREVVPTDASVVVVCARGNRSALAALAMQESGYADVASLSTGMVGWLQGGHPVAARSDRPAR